MRVRAREGIATAAVVVGALVGQAGLSTPPALGIGYAPRPLSVATGPGGDVYLSDPANGQIQRFSPDGQLRDRWGHFGRAYEVARDIAVSAAGDVYVANGVRDRLDVLTAEGAPIRDWRSASRAVAVAPSGSVYVVGYRRVSRYQGSFQVEDFAADGTLLTTWGAGAGGAAHELGEPWGIATGPGGEVYVPDWGGHVRAFSGAGDPLLSWDTAGFSFDLATDAAGNVYVAEGGLAQKVEKFSPAGDLIAVFGSSGTRPGRFVDPMSVAVDSGGDVYVASHSASYLDGGGATRIEKFAADGTFLAQWHAAPALPTRPRVSASVGRRTARRGAVFRFRSQPASARFECRLLGQRVPRSLRRPHRCSSPERYAHLRPGRKAFSVTAVSGGERSSPVYRSWRIVEHGHGRKKAGRSR
jgi:hypothetical protein